MSKARVFTVVIAAIALIAASPIGASATTGRTWSISTMPNADLGRIAGSVSCPSATFCVAVGATNTPSIPFIDEWDGAEWSTMTPPEVDGENVNLLDVSCVSEAFCVAVGNAGGLGDFRTLVETWDGAAWTRTPSPNIDGEFNELAAVSCPTVVSCDAVGLDGSLSKPLIETWNGSEWRRARQPDGVSGGALFAVSCSAPHSCLAVGTTGTSTVLVERGGGIHWSLEDSPPLVGTYDYTFGVSCVSARWCMAVGFVVDDSISRAAEYLWDGASWTTSEDPPVEGHGALLSRISCVAKNACVAAGAGDIVKSNRTTHFQTIESWNGHRWRRDHVPRLPWGGLGGVSCASPNACMVVGAYRVAHNSFAPVAFTNQSLAG